MSFVVQGTVQIDGDAAKAEVKGLGNEVRKTGAQAAGFASKGQAAAAAATAIGTQHQFAAGNVANLTAQFNDIGVMLAAGQNPLQLAIQQGTQITQVFGDRGAAQAGAMLKRALFSMVSPLNLVTIGAIAGGAAFVQWAFSASSAGDEAATFEDHLEALDTAISGYASAADLAALSTDELREKFGSASTGLRITIALLEQIAQNEAQRSIDGVAQSLIELMGIAGDGDRRIGIAGFFDVNIGLAFTDAQRAARSEARQLTAEFLNQQNALKGAAGDLDTQISIMRQMLTTARSLADATDGVSAAEEEVIKKIAETLVKMEQQRGKVEETEAATLNLAQAAVGAAQGFAGAIAPVDTLIGKVRTLADAAWDYAGAMGAEFEAARAAGPDGAVNSTRDRLTPQGLDRDAIVSRVTRAPKPATSTGRRGTGGGSAISETEQEQKAVDDLIASLRQQRDVILETDPIQKEMIQNRRILATATAAEKAQVEELINTRLSEEQAIDRATEKAEFYGSVASSVLDTATQKGAELDDVLKKIAGSFLDAGIQAALFGKGPFGNLFGGTSVFSFLAPQAKADGGKIFGAGGNRDDRVPVAASPGEYIVNARATARNLALLEAINAGAPLPPFRSGGSISGDTARFVGGGSEGPRALHVSVSGVNGNREIAEAVEEGIRLGLQEYDREVLPIRVAEISENPREIG